MIHIIGHHRGQWDIFAVDLGQGGGGSRPSFLVAGGGGAMFFFFFFLWPWPWWPVVDCFMVCVCVFCSTL